MEGGFVEVQVVMPKENAAILLQCLERMKPALIWKRRFSTLVLASTLLMEEGRHDQRGVEFGTSIDCGWFCPC